MTKPKLTEARQTALAILDRAEKDGVDVRFSNITVSLGARRAIYWQSADWLAKHGYATISIDRTQVRLTDAGRALIQEIS